MASLLDALTSDERAELFTGQEFADAVQTELDRKGQPDIPLIYGQGAPEGVVTAPLGCLYVDQTGGKLYVHETVPTPNTGWVVK